MAKIKDKERILKAAGEKQNVAHKKIPINVETVKLTSMDLEMRVWVRELSMTWDSKKRSVHRNARRCIW